MIGLRRGRARFLAIFLLLWGAFVIGRLLQLQVARGSRYRARAQQQQERRVEVSGRRGSILDREGRELAVSMDVSSIYARTERIKDPLAVARALAGPLGLPVEAIHRRLMHTKGFVWIARKIEPAVAAEVAARKIRGIHLVAETKRFYPKGALAAALLGYVGTDDRGLGGLEYSYDRAIRGKPGEIVALTDARLSRYGEAENPARAPREGASLEISIDSGVQFAAERELAAAVAEAGARSGTAVLLDPWNGEVLAMATVPGFDPNAYARFPAASRRNRAVGDAYEPGSTFKIVTGSVALERELVAMDEIIETGDGTIRVGNTIISEHDNRQFGPLTLSGIFEHSSNVGIIRVGLRLGAKGLFEGASAFGVGRPTGIDLPGESPGLFRPLSRWSQLSNASISMGQEVAVTALQLARIVGAVANGGMLVQPRVVRRVMLPGGSMEPVAAAPSVRVLSPATAAAIRDILGGVVERGTGTKAAIPGFAVAGKTGTAQKAGPGGYQPGRYVPNFVGFAPAEHPRLVAVVVIEEPHGKYYAGEVAAPVFARIVSHALGILRVAPREQRLPSTVLASAPAAAPAYRSGVVPASFRQSSAPASSEDPPLEVVPDATGLSARQALALFSRRGIAVRLSGTGFVVGQRPVAGALWKHGESATVFLSQDAPALVRVDRGREEAVSAIHGP